MKRMYGVVCIAIAVLSPLFASGAAEKGNGADDQTRIAFVSPFIGHPYWVTVADGVMRAAGDFGVSVTETGPVGEVNIDTQIRAIETAIASRVDGILTMALNPEAFTPVINRAVEAGIAVVLVDTDAPGSDRHQYVGTSNEAAGYQAGLAILEATGGSATVGIITGAIDADNLNLRIDGFERAVSAESVEITDVQAGNSDLLLQTEKMQSMLQANSDINAVFGSDATGAIAAAKIVEERGLVGDVMIVGFDDLDETLQYIRDGVIYATIVQRNYRMGYQGIASLVDIIAGAPIEREIIDTGVVTVTAANLDSFTTD